MKISGQVLGYRLVSGKTEKPGITLCICNVDKKGLQDNGYVGYQTFECYSSVEYLEKRINIDISKLGEHLSKSANMDIGFDMIKHYYYVRRIDFKL